MWYDEYHTQHVYQRARRSPTVLPSSNTSSTLRCRYSTLKFSIRGWRSTMCREEEILGQKAADPDNGGEEDEDEEEVGGTAPPAAASAASDWLGGPYMLAWLASLEKLLHRGDKGMVWKWRDGKVKIEWCYQKPISLDICALAYICGHLVLLVLGLLLDGHEPTRVTLTERQRNKIKRLPSPSPAISVSLFLFTACLVSDSCLTHHGK